MKYRTSSPNRSNVRTFIVSLLAYALLTSQLAPLAVAANAKLIAYQSARPIVTLTNSGAAQPSQAKRILPCPKHAPTLQYNIALNIVSTDRNRTLPTFAPR